MTELTFEINSSDELWTLIDKRFNHILIYKFTPNEAVAWWKTDLKMKDGELFENLSVRNMEFDIRTDLDGLKRILELNTPHISIYQFDKPVPDTLALQYLPPQHLESILRQNGLKNTYSCEFEFLSVASADGKFIAAIEADPLFCARIEERRKQGM
ncbi:MAG: hypothetical protein K0M63_08710 [Weeksellaceae bacterium]|nr:hypothetical protein [Weeksellaceae bacterium]